MIEYKTSTIESHFHQLIPLSKLTVVVVGVFICE